MRRPRLVLSSLITLLVLLGVPAWLTWRAVRQERLDRALIVAVKRNNVAVVMSLLKQGADANTTVKDEQEASAWEVFRNLFRPFSHKDTSGQKEGYTALMLAVVPSWFDETDGWHDRSADSRIVNALLNAGANPNCRDKNENTPLDYAVHFFPTQVKHLLDKGADVNSKDDNGTTVLMHVQNPSSARLLLDRGADVNAKDGQGRSVLINMIGNAFPADFVRLLLDRGADPNAADQDGRTPLMAAVDEEDADCVHLLLERGAKTDAHDKRHGISALWAAQHNHYTDIANLLKRAGAKE